MLNLTTARNSGSLPQKIPISADSSKGYIPAVRASRADLRVLSCSDITLADYWGVKGIQPEAYNPQGTSLILLHSDKGRALLESCKDKLQITTAADSAFTFNPAVLTPIPKPARYDEFWTGYGEKPFDNLVSACCEPTKEELAKERWNRSLLARAIHRLIR